MRFLLWGPSGSTKTLNFSSGTLVAFCRRIFLAELNGGRSSDSELYASRSILRWNTAEYDTINVFVERLVVKVAGDRRNINFKAVQSIHSYALRVSSAHTCIGLLFALAVFSLRNCFDAFIAPLKLFQFARLSGTPCIRKILFTLQNRCFIYEGLARKSKIVYWSCGFRDCLPYKARNETRWPVTDITNAQYKERTWNETSTSRNGNKCRFVRRTRFSCEKYLLVVEQMSVASFFCFLAVKKARHKK